MDKVVKFATKYLFPTTVDERVKNLPMMGNPAWIWIIIGSYMIFIKWLGPRLMKGRDAFYLKPLLIIYNSGQTLANVALGVYAVQQSYARSDWSLWCQPYMPHDDSILHRRYGRIAYCYFLLKLADLLDTVFFVLRKKANQVSFLHLYHHSMMVLTSYFCVKNLVLGHIALMPIMNTFVHAIMYTYYLVTCVRPKVKESLWWKKYITQIQLLQFLILFVHFGRPLLMQDCNYPNLILVMCFLQNFLMIVLFSDFYRKQYLMRPKLQQKQQTPAQKSQQTPKTRHRPQAKSHAL